jgi:protein-S-isoprenylcysteine O-methyltransferase Ste14
MGVGRLVDRLVRESGKPRSAGFKFAVIAMGAVTFLIIFPSVLFLAANAFARYFTPGLFKSIEIGFGALCIAAGLVFLAWCFFTQLRTGEGTPVPVAPPQKLITTGPYKLCRNPIQLGLIVYLLGLGTFFGSLGIGILMFLMGLVIGCAYHKLVEEKELVARFGKEYEEYRAKTPYLIPRLRP